MKDLLVFCGEHPLFSLLVICALLSLIGSVLINLPNQILRHWNIRKHGYPPPHCDADGDFKEESK